MQKQGIRQVRVNDPKQFHQRLSESVGKNVNLVFHDRTPLTGKVLAVTERTVDMENMRLKRMSFELTDIAEVYIDLIV